MDKEIIYLRKNDNIEELLEYAMKEKQFIFTEESTRGIGKSMSLINFAKKHNFGVIVPNIVEKRHHIKEFNYKEIYSVDYIEVTLNDVWIKQLKGFVVDECVKDVRKLASKINIITGFITDRDFYNNKTYSDNETIEQLDINKSKLLQKINKSQDNNNQSDYKMLINNLLKTIEVRDTLKNPNKDATINNQYHFDTVNLPNVVNADDLIKELGNFGSKQFSMNYKYDY